MSVQKMLFATDSAVIIPALNEASKIASVIRSIMPTAVPIVVDDGSTDGTAQIAADAGAIVVSHERNLGYDAALQTGLFKAIELGFDYGITFDGDGQHDPHHIEIFIAQLKAGADVVIGHRGHMQRAAEGVFALVARTLWRIDDPLCGMKGYRLENIAQLGYFDSYKSIGTEFSIRAARSRFRVINILISTTPRAGTSRFGIGLRPNLRILRALWFGLVRASSIRTK
jgi:glycosyltransferase involved in cell wall biosynthesis